MIDEEKLILLVQKYACLYDIRSSHYSDQQRKNNAWDEISRLLSSSAEECKKKWTKLRENYRKSLSTREKPKSGSATIKHRTIKFEKQLSFLNESFKPRPSISNLLPDDSEDTREDDSNINSEAENQSYSSHNEKENSRKRRNLNNSPKRNVVDVLETYIESNREKPDELILFFKGITETVKSFPKETQIHLKRQIFELVNDAEVSLQYNLTNTNNFLTNRGYTTIQNSDVNSGASTSSTPSAGYCNTTSSTEINFLTNSSYTTPQNSNINTSASTSSAPVYTTIRIDNTTQDDNSSYTPQV